mmetsp:Transcript_13022/g.51631  ORF Transcript_13022/g.51631 Transcript_13022/m.51631 type:complete len:87 (-) Transcript_13022:1506-1766(-)
MPFEAQKKRKANVLEGKEQRILFERDCDSRFDRSEFVSPNFVSWEDRNQSSNGLDVIVWLGSGWLQLAIFNRFQLSRELILKRSSN